MATVFMHFNNEDGRFTTAKLVSGVTAKFIITFFFAFGYTMNGEYNPTGIRQRCSAVLT